MAPIYVNGSIAAIESGAYLPSGGTLGQILTKDSAADHDASWHIAPYAYFYFNSGGSQGANRFNDWDDLFVALGEIDGAKKVTFEQDEIMPAGAYDMTDVTFGGNRNPGDVSVTLADGVTFTTWARGGITDALTMSSDSNSAIMDIDSGVELINCAFTSAFASQNTPFFVTQTTGQLILPCFDGGSIQNSSAGALGGSEVIEADNTGGSLYLPQVGTSPGMDDDVLAGDGVALRLKQTVVADSTQGNTQTNFSGTFLTITFTEAVNLGYDPSGTLGVLTATNVQDALDELAGLV